MSGTDNNPSSVPSMPPTHPTRPPSPPRFLTLAQVSDELATSNAQTYALVRSGALRAIKVGGRGQWRVGREDLESYVSQAYQDTAAFVRAHPLRAGEEEPLAGFDSSREPFSDET